MNFHGMKRKDLQALCKKNGIPANLKNIEMATRLASVLQKETEGTLTDTISLSEDSVDVLEDDVAVKKVRFSPENEVFEFTRSLKRCQRKYVSKRKVQESGIELRRSKRSVAKGKAIAGSSENESNTRRGNRSDVTKAIEVPRRSKRSGSTGSSQEDCKVTELMALEQFEFENISEGLSGSDQDGFKFEKIGRRSTQLISKTGNLLPVNKSKRLVDIKDNEDELVKNNVNEVSMDQRRSIRLKARAANQSMGGESSDGRPLCSAKETKEEIKIKQSKRSTVVSSQKELVERKAKEPLVDSKVPRRSKRLANDVNVLLDKRPVKAVKPDYLKVKKAPKQSRRLEKSLSELLVDGQAQKGDKQRTFGNGREGKKLLRSSKHTASNNMLGQALSNSLKRCSVIDGERAGVSVGDVKKSNVNNEMQIRVRVTRNSSRHHSFKAPIEFERNLIEKKSDETFVKSSKRGTRRMKRGRSAEPGKDIETQSNLTSKKLLNEYTQFEQEEACDANVEVRGSSKKAKTMNQECVKDIPQVMTENSPSSSETIAAESVMIVENVLDSSPEKSVDSSQRTNTQELNSEVMEGKHEEKLEGDTVLMVAIEEEKKEVSSSSVLLSERLSPTSVQFAVSNSKAELVVPTGHILLNDFAEENSKTKEEGLIFTPVSELKEPISVEAILENSVECWNEIHLSKHDEKGTNIQAENLHGNFSECNTENSKVVIVHPEMLDEISVSHCVDLEMLDEVKNGNLEKSEQRSGCKLNPLELKRFSSTDFTSHSLKEKKVSKCFKEDELRAWSEPLPRNKNASAFDELAIFTTPERNLMLRGKLSENGKTLAADSVIHHNVIAVESHAVVFTASKQAGTDEAGKEEEHTATKLNTTKKLGGSRQTEARNEGESIVVELHDESDIATSLERQLSAGDSKGEGIGRNEENMTVELHCEPDTCTSPDGHTLLGNYVSDGAENSEENKAMEFNDESVDLTASERHEICRSFGQDRARESEGKKVVLFYEESLHSDQPLADSELGEAECQEINSADKSSLFTSLERQQLFYKCYVPNVREDSERDEAATSEENKAVELQVDCGIFTTPEKHLLLETDEGVKGDNITAKSHVLSDVLAADVPHSLMGDSEPDEAEKNSVEIKDVELLGESNSSTNPESPTLFGNSELDESRDSSAATCEEAFVTTSPEKELLINPGKQEQKEVDENVVQESHVAAPDFRGNTIVDSSGGIASKVSYNHELNAGQETACAELMSKGSQAEDVVGLDATQGTSKKRRGHSPHADSVNLFDSNIEEVDTIMEAERNISFSSYVAVPAEGNSETIGEISSYLEVAGTCSMVFDESGSSTDIQNQINDALKEWAITDKNEADELIEAIVTKNIQKDFEGNLLLNSSGGGSNVSGETSILAGTADEDEAAGPIAIAFVKAMSLTPDELTVKNHMNEKAADEEMITRETTPIPEETINESSENRKEYSSIDESATLSEMQVRREPTLIFRTQVKPTKHDMKENAPNSKIVHNLNVTAPRTSKRQPLQDLNKN
ncbi:hypothetical protein ISN44_As01g066390 [Arabidopsis suecica]|uniref:Uncharacterized protein n=1 Tax=Arabidopsis suecica TaxID=45249 RepID=A0A8T2HGR9_ARASU|nr:hypothetical protein ISN44_As01g066390 [Arabidopsis suecica]